MTSTADIYCTYCFSGWHEAIGCDQRHADEAEGKHVPYPGFCRHPSECAGRGSCPREISCVD